MEKEGEALSGSQLVEEEDTNPTSRELGLKRECPIPKPGGIVGEVLGFKSSSSDGKGSKPP